MTKAIRKNIEEYRGRTYRLHPDDRVKSKREAVGFINQRGFALFHPAKDLEFPSLWKATNGDRAVPNEHDDPGHITWQWKDELLGERQCYYGRLIGQKMSFVSLKMLPYFFRLSKNIEWENDYLLQYQKGEMSYEAKQMYEVLLDEGPMDTLQLRKKAGLWGQSNSYRYSKNLNWLQQELMIFPVGVAAVGRWNNAFILDILPRFLPELPDQSLELKMPESRDKILESVFLSLGAVDEKSIRKLLRWSSRSIEKSLGRLNATGFVQPEIEVDGETRRQWVLTELLI